MAHAPFGVKGFEHRHRSLWAHLPRRSGFLIGSAWMRNRLSVARHVPHGPIYFTTPVRACNPMDEPEFLFHCGTLGSGANFASRTQAGKADCQVPLAL